MSSSSATAPLAAAATADSLTVAAPSIPKHWRRVTTVCSVEALEDPAKPGEVVSDADLLDWLCQILSGELRAQEPPAGTPPMDLLRKAITSNLTDAERIEFFESLRSLKK